MSLINEALKRAQHLRKEEAAGHATPPPGDPSHRIAHRGKPMASQTLMLIVAGSVAIVVITVVATVYLLRDEKPSPATDRAPAPAVVKTPEVAPASTDTAPAVVLSIPNSATNTTTAQTAAAPVVTAPIPAPVVAKLTPPAPKPVTPVTQPVTQPVAAATVPAATVPTSAPATTAPIATAPAATSPVATAPAAAASVAPDQQVLIYLDNLRVLGVRFSGLDSKVLIGDRVFRINDIIERNFGLRLVEVQPDRLFFVDARGAAYTKNL